jgi:hypothetical protein
MTTFLIKGIEKSGTLTITEANAKPTTPLPVPPPAGGSSLINFTEDLEDEAKAAKLAANRGKRTIKKTGAPQPEQEVAATSSEDPIASFLIDCVMEESQGNELKKALYEAEEFDKSMHAGKEKFEEEDELDTIMMEMTPLPTASSTGSSSSIPASSSTGLPAIALPLPAPSLPKPVFDYKDAGSLFSYH